MSSPNGFKILCVIIQANYPQCSRAYSHISLFKIVFYRFSNFYFSITSDMQAGSCLVDYKDLYLSEFSRVLKVREPRFKSSVLTARSIICLAVGVPHFKDNVLVARYMSTAPTDFASTSYGQIYEHTPSCFASTNNVTIKSIFDVNK